MTPLLAILGNKDRRRNGGLLADRLAATIAALLREGITLGELEDVQVRGIDGQPRSIKIFPRRWLARLELAVAADAFGRMPVKEIVDRILTTEAPPA